MGIFICEQYSGNDGIVLHEGTLKSQFNYPVTIIPRENNFLIPYFNYMPNFNQPVAIPYIPHKNHYNDVLSAVVSYCNNFNSQIIIGNGYYELYFFFSGCNKYNKPITIPDSVTHCTRFISSCHNFNAPITFPNTLQNIYFGFVTYCNNFNQPLDFSGCENLYSFDRLVEGCRNFNAPVTLPNNSRTRYYFNEAFAYCSKFNQSIYIPYNTYGIYNMFDDCTSLWSDIYLPRKFNNRKTTSFWENCPVSVENGTLHFY